MVEKTVVVWVQSKNEVHRTRVRFMSSLKFNLNGSRRVRICAFKDLEFYLLSQKPADSAVTLQEVNECLSEVATVV